MEKDNLKLKFVLVFNFPMKIKSLEVSNICLDINRPGCLKVNIRKRNTKKEIRTTTKSPNFIRTKDRHRITYVLVS